MNIGIDLDGVLFDTENWFRTYATFYNAEHFKCKEVDREELYFQKRYLWSKEQESEFYEDCYRQIEREAPLMPYAKMVIDKLKNQGHKLYIITRRGHSFSDEIPITETRFKEEGLVFDGYYFGTENKAEICKNLKIDLMIDDLYENIESVSLAGIKCLYFRDLVLKRFEDNALVHEVRNWAEIYCEVLGFDNW